MRWLLMRSGKWHAWPLGGRTSECGRVNHAHLPAEEIRAALPDDALVCAVCARKMRLADRVVQDTTDVTKAWLAHLRLYLTRLHVRVSITAVQKFAQRLSEIGRPDEEETRAMFEQLRPLFLTPVYTQRKAGKRAVTTATLPLQAALRELPPRHGVLRDIAKAVYVWRAITQRDITLDRCNAARVVRIMLQIPDIEAYVRHLHSRDLSHLAAVFHPNTLERAKKDTALRGIFGGSTRYWDQTSSQPLNVITD